MNITVAGRPLTAPDPLARAGDAKLYPVPPHGWIRATLIDDTLDLDFVPGRSMETMNITLNGKPVKLAGELKVGEHGFSSTKNYSGAMPAEATRLCPIMTPPMGNCYKVTRVDDGTLDVEFVPAVCHLPVAMDEIVVVEINTGRFERRVRELQQDGWRVDAESLYVTHDDGTPSCMALLHRVARDE